MLHRSATFAYIIFPNWNNMTLLCLRNNFPKFMQHIIQNYLCNAQDHLITMYYLSDYTGEFKRPERCVSKSSN